jgi:MFS family permease
MLLGGIIFFIGAALNAGAVDLSMLIAGRILLGVGVGFSTQVISPSIYNKKKINALWWHHVFHRSSIYHAFYMLN